MTQTAVSFKPEIHQSVLLEEVIELLLPERGGIFVDATLGMGGHAQEILERAKKERKEITIIGIDQDEQALTLAKERLGEAIQYLYGNFGQLKYLLSKEKITSVDGILMDLGVSSFQINTPERGFSFSQNGPLDMRMDENLSTTAAHIINGWSEYKLANLFFSLGEERFSRRIAQSIVEKRKLTPFQDTASLASLISQAYPAALRYKHPHPATKVFQALRIEVNAELAVLEDGLNDALSLLAPGGRLAVISFHSLEDRIVKQRFRKAVEEGGYGLLTKRPLTPTAEEESSNSRSRSAKLRGIVRV